MPNSIMPASPYPVLDDYITVHGDALVLFDLHTPYHNADFINKVLKIAAAWKIPKLILGGDFIDSENLSKFGAKLAHSYKINYDRIFSVVKNISQEEKDKVVEAFESMGLKPEDNLPAEFAYSREALRVLNAQFAEIYAIMGNHEARAMRRADIDMTARAIVDFCMNGSADKWQIESYYYCLLESAGEVYRVEHPHGAGPNEAQGISIQHNQHVIMGHSHRLSYGRAANGKLAIQAGHCADERRMAYVAERSKGGGAVQYAHASGAVIVRGGHAWLLDDNSDWDMLRKCK